MPKIKTMKGAAKRFRLTARGRIRRRRAYASHLLTKKPGDHKRALGAPALVSASDYDRIRRLIPYA